VTKAATLAAIQEGLLLRQKTPPHKFSSPKNLPAGKHDSPAPPPVGELWKARQLKEYRKLNGLCFKCGEKFIPGHKCKQPASPTLNYIAVDEGVDGGIILSDEVLEQLESPQSIYAPDDVFVSLNAITGADKARLIKFRALASNQVVLQLLDTGSSHTFLNAGLLNKLPCNMMDIAPTEVRVANGQTIMCTQMVKNFSWWVQGHTFTVDALVLPLGAYDMVLGMNWLEQFRPMTCDWQDKWVEFHYQDKFVMLQGVLSLSPQLQEISAEQLHKSSKGNDIWAMAVVTPALDVPPPPTPPIPAIIQQLIAEHSAVFRDPKA